MLVSAKSGLGVHDVLEAIVQRVPPPKGSPDAPLAALIFDSWFDPYRGVIILTRVLDGRLRLGQKIRLWASGKTFEVEGLGLPVAQSDPLRRTGGRRGRLRFRQHQDDLRRADRRHHHEDRTPPPSRSPVSSKSSPWCSPGSIRWSRTSTAFLRDALEKLRFNDSAFNFEPENSVALGFGFRCGFLGLLHLEIVQERLEREFDIDLITTAPGVRYA
jgi:GTP-binding protein LepA